MPIHRLVLFALGLIFVAHTEPAGADDWNIVLNGRSVHVDATHDWNESNLGLGFEREFGNGGRWIKVALGSGFRDSRREMSYMAGGGIKRRFRFPNLSRDFYVDVGALGFVMTRVDIDNNRPFPGILPAFTVGTRRLALNVTYVPGQWVNDTAMISHYDPSLDGIFFLQIKLAPEMLKPRSRQRPYLAGVAR